MLVINPDNAQSIKTKCRIFKVLKRNWIKPTSVLNLDVYSFKLLHPIIRQSVFVKLLLEIDLKSVIFCTFDNFWTRIC